jgi:hypothetical protein
MILAKSQKNNFLREYFVFGAKPLTLKIFPDLLRCIGDADNEGCET